MLRVGLIIVAVVYVFLGAYMWFAPLRWYENTPGVAMMGPYNAHFVRDVAIAFFVSGAALGWAWWKHDKTAGVIGAACVCLHALFHIWIWIFMRGFAFDQVTLVNLLGIQAPAWIALAAALKIEGRGTGA